MPPSSRAASGKRCGTYEGERGYQPMLVVWGEMDVVLADEFRDGNVPAMMAPLAVAKRAFAALPATVESLYYRGDSASHERELMQWLRDEKRAEGPPGIHRFRDQCAQERSFTPGDLASKGGELGSLRGAPHEGDPGMRRGGVCAGGKV